MCFDLIISQFSHAILGFCLTCGGTVHPKDHPRQVLFLFFGHAMQLVGIFVPRSGMEPWPKAVKAPSPNPWIAREFPRQLLSKFQSRISQSGDHTSSRAQEKRIGETKKTLKGLRTGERKGEGNRSEGSMGRCHPSLHRGDPSPGLAQPDAAAPAAGQPEDAETKESRPARAWTPGPSSPLGLLRALPALPRDWAQRNDWLGGPEVPCCLLLCAQL